MRTPLISLFLGGVVVGPETKVDAVEEEEVLRSEIPAVAEVKIGVELARANKLVHRRVIHLIYEALHGCSSSSAAQGRADRVEVL